MAKPFWTHIQRYLNNGTKVGAQHVVLLAVHREVKHSLTPDAEAFNKILAFGRDAEREAWQLRGARVIVYLPDAQTLVLLEVGGLPTLRVLGWYRTASNTLTADTCRHESVQQVAMDSLAATATADLDQFSWEPVLDAIRQVPATGS